MIQTQLIAWLVLQPHVMDFPLPFVGISLSSTEIEIPSQEKIFLDKTEMLALVGVKPRKLQPSFLESVFPLGHLQLKLNLTTSDILNAKIRHKKFSNIQYSFSCTCIYISSTEWQKKLLLRPLCFNQAQIISLTLTKVI